MVNAKKLGWRYMTFIKFLLGGGQLWEVCWCNHLTLQRMVVAVDLVFRSCSTKATSPRKLLGAVVRGSTDRPLNSRVQSWTGPAALSASSWENKTNSALHRYYGGSDKLLLTFTPPDLFFFKWIQLFDWLKLLCWPYEVMKLISVIGLL